MSTVNERIHDASIRHMVWLERFKSGEVNRIIALLNKADNDLVEQIAARLAKIEERGFDLGPDTTKRLKVILDGIRAQRVELYEYLEEEAADGLREFSFHEAEFQASIIEKSASGTVAISLERPSLSQLRATVMSQPFQGRLLKEWFSGLAEADAQRVNDAVRIGITEGQTTDQIVRRIRGTRAARYTDGILELSRRNAQTIVRTAVAHVADRAGQSVWEANADIIKGVKWVSTLDGRTSPTCRERDGKVYPLKSAPPVPAHYGCRSRKVPYLGETSVKGTRASEIGPVPEDVTYERWLRMQPASVQDEVLGKAKAKLFREGGLPLDRFSDANGKSYTLQQLRDRDREIFDDVFGGSSRRPVDRATQEADFRDYLGEVTYTRMRQGVKKAMAESGVSDYGLSEAEQVAIHAYTHGDKYFDRLNAALRSDDAEAIARVSPMASVLDTALEKLPSYTGKSMRVTDLPESVAKGISVGQVYTDPAFISSSKRDLGKSFGQEYRFTIVKSHKGKEINGFSAYASEDEVLFPRGTKFDIIDVDDKAESGFVEVFMAEKDD